jgi:hypothetical protein
MDRIRIDYLPLCPLCLLPVPSLQGRDLSRACEEKEKEAAVGVLLDSAKEKNQVTRPAE